METAPAVSWPDAERADEAVATSSEELETIRITRHGKIRDWVKRALDFFNNQPDRPLVLYSTPADVTTSTVARLVTVVEIIKREYLKRRDISNGDVSGLHQYTQLLSEQRAEDQRDALSELLDGHSHLKQSYMKITLSVNPIALGDVRGTYQAPMVRRMTKAAKARMRKRQKKQADGV